MVYRKKFIIKLTKTRAPWRLSDNTKLPIIKQGTNTKVSNETSYLEGNVNDSD
jgi:hypothetical protein